MTRVVGGVWLAGVEGHDRAVCVECDCQLCFAPMTACKRNRHCSIIRDHEGSDPVTTSECRAECGSVNTQGSKEMFTSLSYLAPQRRSPGSWATCLPKQKLAQRLP